MEQVTQADREAAARFVIDCDSRGKRAGHDKVYLRGEGDGSVLVRTLVRHRIEATQAKDEEIARLKSALERIANHKPLFDYVGCDENGINDDVPGSPYDRGKEAGVKLLADVARKALGASNA